jgi:hypothetical protein
MEEENGNESLEAGARAKRLSTVTLVWRVSVKSFLSSVSGLIQLRTALFDRREHFIAHNTILLFLCLNPLLFASCTDTVKLLEAWRGVLSSTPPYK